MRANYFLLATALLLVTAIHSSQVAAQSPIAAPAPAPTAPAPADPAAETALSCPAPDGSALAPDGYPLYTTEGWVVWEAQNVFGQMFVDL